VRVATIRRDREVPVYIFGWKKVSAEEAQGGQQYLNIVTVVPEMYPFYP